MVLNFPTKKVIMNFNQIRLCHVFVMDNGY